jgi:hypothetical protein
MFLIVEMKSEKKEKKKRQEKDEKKQSNVMGFEVVNACQIRYF